MKQRGRMYRLSVWLVYSGVALMVGSGIGWLLLDSFGQQDGEFGPEKHPAQFYLIRFHGALAMGMMMIFGGLLATHVRHYWRKIERRTTGVILIATWTLLMASAYALYYAGGESLRAVAHWTHIVLGLGLPIWLVVHVWKTRGEEA
ncbi:MAG TPA: hypothetical protein VIH35_09285 [Kiritimatiellia bacterium]|jgi:hypothetical protein